ncbi:hypothetical protein GGR54DRAFT_309726 [Hypoxylon sp. NC1633]|nr:hypothetical protein GGR54DRAFT_309726 [Hypoxylon sp. NC1633]
MSVTMMNLAVRLLLIVLAAVAIYVQVTSSDLSLPLSTGTTVLTIILPFLAAANIIYTPLLNRFLRRRIESVPALQLLPVALQVIQAVLTVVLATLAAQGFVPGQMLECSLEESWKLLWHNHDGRAIERIQDTFNCCGLRTVKDRGWPNGRCMDLNKGRHNACLNSWRSSMQRSAGLEFTIAIAVGLLQLVNLALFTLRSSEDRRAKVVYRQFTENDDADSRAGLLENGVADSGDDAGDGANGNGHTGTGGREYGTLEDGTSPRIEPSGLGDEHRNWRSIN